MEGSRTGLLSSSLPDETVEGRLEARLLLTSLDGTCTWSSKEGQNSALSLLPKDLEREAECDAGKRCEEWALLVIGVTKAYFRWGG